MIKVFDKLYARDGKGKVLQWNTRVITNGSSVDISISYGEYDGAQVLRWRRNIKGKNIGKTNETTPYDQAVKDCESEINKQRHKGYMTFEEATAHYIEPKTDRNITFDIAMDDMIDTTLLKLEKCLPEYRTDASGNVKPMKCQQYYRSKKNWKAPDGKIWDDRKYYYLLNPYIEKEKGAIITSFPCIGQPKINGVRCTIKLEGTNIVMRSKDGLEYDIAHIKDFLTINNDVFFHEGKELILDGELYIHNELLQDIRSAVVKFNLNTPRIKFVLFDLAIEDKTNIQRWSIIKQHILPKLEQHLNCCIELITATKITSDERAQKYTDLCIENGYEGAIFRQLDASYQFGKRPMTITKLKRTISEEFKITDIIPQSVDNTQGNYRCITREGLSFDVTPKGTEEFKRELLYNSRNYIGKNLTLEFYEWTDAKKPFHIVNSTVRDYE